MHVHHCQRKWISLFPQGIPRKPPKTGYSAFTQEKLSSGRLKEIEPLGNDFLHRKRIFMR